MYGYHDHSTHSSSSRRGLWKGGGHTFHWRSGEVDHLGPGAHHPPARGLHRGQVPGVGASSMHAYRMRYETYETRARFSYRPVLITLTSHLVVIDFRQGRISTAENRPTRSST